MRKAFIMTLFVGLPTLCEAQDTCKDIVDDQARLQCYDEREASKQNATVAAQDTVLESRQRQEKSMFENNFGIMQHRRSYLLPFSYVDAISKEQFAGNIDPNSDEELDNLEIKFQYSFKVPIGHQFLLGDDQLYFGFTQLSLWQAYNRDLSSPFRENNYQPELLWEIPLSHPLFNGRLSHVVLGLNHHSNGLGGSLSRSWNRITFDTTWADPDWAINLKLWKRIEEAPEDDDNPDIEDYLGYGQLQLGYSWGTTRFTGIIYNNFEREDNHTSVDVSFSMPISRNLRGFVQYFNGYGETLINYDRRTRRVGIGVVLSDWF